MYPPNGLDPDAAMWTVVELELQSKSERTLSNPALSPAMLDHDPVFEPLMTRRYIC